LTLQSNIIGIIADDLTGANDTALQFHLKGCNTQILLDYSIVPAGTANTQVWAVNTQTRNLPVQAAVDIVKKATKSIIENLNVDFLYKKIDSTLRGNIAQESLAMLEVIEGDAVVMVPAYPAEGRTTVGGYQLLKGMPLERTDVARDPHFPIYQSHIPTLLQQQVDNPEIVAHIQLMTVMKGAGPLLMELKKLVDEGKKLIVVDAVTTTDMEQIALAIEKSQFNLLPCGAAGLAQVLAKSRLPDTKHQHITKVIPSLPVLIVSGSKSELSKVQLKKLAEFDEFDAAIVDIRRGQILGRPDESLIESVNEHLQTEKIVAIHFAEEDRGEGSPEESGTEESGNLPGLIIDFLAEISAKVMANQELILVAVGGETAYKCCSAIGSRSLQLIDQVEPSIPLCLDHEARWIVTKSGNFGSPNTLVNIVKYFHQHQEL
jgi:uncharacterized protein YgbK (DUF1537 family)